MDVSERIDNIRSKLFRDSKSETQERRFSISRRLLLLSNSIASYTGVPSLRELQKTAKISEDLNAISEAINGIIEINIRSLNKSLKEKNLPCLTQVKKISIF
jgi:hypothetical protein